MIDVLANWVWQGCVIAAGAALVSCGARHVRRVRLDSVWLVALILVVVSPVVPPTVFRGVIEIDALGDTLGTAVPVSSSRVTAILWWTWGLWSAVAAVRVGRAFFWQGRVRRDAAAFPAARESGLAHWVRVCARGGRVRLVVSDRVRSAVAFGVWSPTVAVSPAALRRLTDEELDRVLVHEWVHVQRRDAVVRWVQALTIVLAGFHPAVWWINRRLDLAREVSCDARVVEETGGAKAYAATLVAVVGLSVDAAYSTDARVPALGASTHLRGRIRELVSGRPRLQRATWEPAMGVATLVGLTAVASGLTIALTRAPIPARVLAALDHVLVRMPSEERQPLIDSHSFETATEPSARLSARAAPHAGWGGAAVADVDTGEPVEPVGVAHSAESSDLLVAREVDRLDALASSVSPVANVDGNSERRTLRFPAVDMATESGVAVGRGSQRAAVATAMAFTQLGKRIRAAF